MRTHVGMRAQREADASLVFVFASQAGRNAMTVARLKGGRLSSGPTECALRNGHKNEAASEGNCYH
jgi:hypothetical protein